MSWTLLLPAVAVVIALLTLAIGLRIVEVEAAALRATLRRAGATAVAADELRRATSAVAEQAVTVEADARRRVHRPWSRRRRNDR